MIAPLARPTAVRDAFAAEAAAMKAEHDFWNQEFLDHERACPDCQRGLRCKPASFLADLADDYGKRWEWAEERSGAGR